MVQQEQDDDDLTTNNNNKRSSNAAVADESALLLRRLGQYYRERERKIKKEIAVVSLLWLVGCPVLCCFAEAALDGDNDGGDQTLYGTPDYQGLCGLLSYSISASMTGQYPKVWGSLLAPLFALLVVQRSSTGLCSNLKLGWMIRYSPLLLSLSSASAAASKTTTGPHEDDDDEKKKATVLIATKLWRHIERIEYLGYLAAVCLVALVAFDAKEFALLHILFATGAFYALLRQNRLVGALSENKDFGSIFHNFTNEHSKKVFNWGMFHIVVMYGLYFFFGTLRHFSRCNDMQEILQTISIKWFGNTTTMRWIVSVMFWYNEYAFAFLCIYVQMLEHYEFQLWEFVGAINMPYMAIVSKFSIHSALEQVLGGGGGSSSSGVNVYLGLPPPHARKVKGS